MIHECSPANHCMTRIGVACSREVCSADYLLLMSQGVARCYKSTCAAWASAALIGNRWNCETWVGVATWCRGRTVKAFPVAIRFDGMGVSYPGPSFALHGRGGPYLTPQITCAGSCCGQPCRVRLMDCPCQKPIHRNDALESCSS